MCADNGRFIISRLYFISWFKFVVHSSFCSVAIKWTSEIGLQILFLNLHRLFGIIIIIFDLKFRWNMNINITGRMKFKIIFLSLINDGLLLLEHGKNISSRRISLSLSRMFFRTFCLGLNNLIYYRVKITKWTVCLSK